MKKGSLIFTCDLHYYFLLIPDRIWFFFEIHILLWLSMRFCVNVGCVLHCNYHIYKELTEDGFEHCYPRTDLFFQVAMFSLNIFLFINAASAQAPSNQKPEWSIRWTASVHDCKFFLLSKILALICSKLSIIQNCWQFSSYSSWN